MPEINDCKKYNRNVTIVKVIDFFIKIVFSFRLILKQLYYYTSKLLQSICIPIFSRGMLVLVTFHTYAKVVGIMRQNACTLAFCVHQLLQFTPNVRKLLQNLALV